ncbi:MAG: glutamate synthase large subunit [Verrucomicrobia bacterium]|nr:glutamate synthase large subunit [Verrucomicrobiota bacterium]
MARRHPNRADRAVVETGLPDAQGLYDPRYEHDSCGVGFVCRLDGAASHAIVADALTVLDNLTHRGASGSDPSTGDGAGLLLQLPHAFFKKVAGELGIPLPDFGEYGVGMLFLPRDDEQRAWCVQLVEDVVKAEGQCVLGWRDVPTDNETIGRIARLSEPVIRQVFVGRGAGIADDAAFERKLYVIRKVLERTVRESDLPQRRMFYVPTLSCRRITYKGLLLTTQLRPYYPDLIDPDMATGIAVVHQRYSTNTFPTWDLAQPFRFLCHNGEINTLRGNINWMTARQSLFRSPLFGDDMGKLFPIATPGASDSAILDNTIELLYHTGRSLPHAVMMCLPEAWERHETMSDEKKAFYEYHSCLMEPWDGPASIPFTDGKCLGAVLDRNGLRPSRYLVTKDGLVVMASETGVLDIPPGHIAMRGRLQPGRMFLVDTEQGRIVQDEEIKHEMAARKPYRAWLSKNMLRSADLPPPDETDRTAQPDEAVSPDTLQALQRAFGYTLEDVKIILAPMAAKGKEPVGSMGNDVPLAVLSDRPQLLFSYFKQLFAQVTNPPLDAIREELVTSLISLVGAEQSLFEETPRHCAMLSLEQPVLTNEAMAQVRAIDVDAIGTIALSTLFEAAEGVAGLERALDALCTAAEQAVDDGYAIIILTDRGVDMEHAPIPSLLATAAVHHHLVRTAKRTRCGLVIESGEPRETMHFALLIAYGACAVNPYVALETIGDLARSGRLDSVTPEEATDNYVRAVDKGLLKIISKMGVSTLQGYRGAQIVEAVGLHKDVIDKYFPWTASRIGGIGLDVIADETLKRHTHAFPPVDVPAELELDEGGQYQWRRRGEHHLFNPQTIATLQHATRTGDRRIYDTYARLINDQAKRLGTLRGLLDFKAGATPVPLDEVEPWTEIVKRFKTGAMSYGSISQEAHETLAVAMNRLGAKSNSGEGGEDPARYARLPGGDRRVSRIKQVASGRFGVTSNYLVNCDEIQIKMAQGAKPGEGGQLPGEKVLPWIAKVRHSTPYVPLISPPPHHDIYSIEDLAQLIHDLKNANRAARISVKLVSEVGVGIIAAGVAKGKADVVLISGHDGGTGASPLSSIKHAGLPWELGLAETQQTLVMNDLRSRIVVEVDGQMKTGRDVAIAALLGAEEYGFATAPLVVLGCVMMRKCQLNTCPVGVATQDPELRKNFAGKPEHLINFFRFVAEELRAIMARLGFRSVGEMIGRVEQLEVRPAVEHWKAGGLDFAKVLHKPDVAASVGTRCTRAQDHGIEQALDNELIELCRPALERREQVVLKRPIRNTNRTIGTMLSSEISRRWGEQGLPDYTIILHLQGTAGQSLAAFGARGLTIHVEGDANDYVGKGLSGAIISVRPPAGTVFKPDQNIICGNVALYGATGGEAYISGVAGERFAVRNSGAKAVVEGVGDHGCEYMTGGRVVVLGRTGRNFAAGMSGGIAYVLDETAGLDPLDGTFARHLCNREMVVLEPLTDPYEIDEVRTLIQYHFMYTQSVKAVQVLRQWDEVAPMFVKVMPIDYRRALERLARERAERQGAMIESE